MHATPSFFRSTVAILFAVTLSVRADTWTLDFRARGSMPTARSAPETGLVRRSVLPGDPSPVPPLVPGDTVVLLLFDDTRISLRLDEAMPAPLSEGRVFTASRTDGPGAGARTAVVIADRDGLTATVPGLPGGNVVRVFRSAEGTIVEERDPSAEPHADAAPLLPPEGSARPPSKAAPGEQSDQLVDVLVVYDKGAQDWVSHNGGMANFAETAVQRMNAALANTKLDEVFRCRLVAVMGVDATQTDLNTALAAVRGGNGVWSEVHEKRDAVGADVVTLLIDNGFSYGTVGLGYALSATTASSAANFSESAYNVCLVRSVAISDTMTHEIGHNLGCGHSNTQSDGGPGPQSFPYSSGYHFTGSDSVRYHTVMAYYTDGTYDDYEAIPYFSSPDFAYAGVPAGTADANDNTRVLRQTAAWAGNWRDLKIPLSYDVFFSPSGGTIFTGSLTVSLIPGRAGIPVRYTLDGSAPSLSSPLYEGPFVLTETTTVRAAAVTNGILGPVCEATYFLDDLGDALDAAQLSWTTNPDCPWIFETDDTWDGSDALQSTDDGQFFSDASWLSATVEGPAAMSFRYKMRSYGGTFSVQVDGTARFEDTRDVHDDTWHLGSVYIPEGTHTVKFVFEQHGGRYEGFNGAWLDDISFSAPSSPPVLSPSTTADHSTATVFSRALAVTLLPPDGVSGTIYYTLDGSAPSLKNAIVYDGPILLTSTTRIRAIFVEDGKGPSAEASGLYRESHPVEPGEWTTDAEAVQASAARDGRLIAVLLANRDGCWWSRQFYSVAEDPAFLAWAQANGIYLVTADASCNFDTDAAEDWFWQLYWSSGDSGSVYYPTLYFALPGAPSVAVGKGLARNDGSSAVGTEPYLDTVASLVSGFASVLGETVPLPPTASPADSLVAAFPLQVALSNPNPSGTIYWTLDGSSPTPSTGTGYSGPVTVPAASAVLRAAVWASSGFSSPVFVGAYKTIAGILGARGIAWTVSGTGGWSEDASAPATLRAGGLMDDAFQTTLRATVEGKGKLVFTYAFNTWSRQNTFSFSVNGRQQWQHAYNGSISFSDTVTHEVSSDGPTTFAWTLTIDDPSCDYGPGYTSQSGAWLSSVRWIPADEDAWTWEEGPDGGATVTGGPTEGALVVPDTLGGLPVTGIGTGAFQGSGITAVSFPDSLSRIGERAFEGCNGLAVVEIGRYVSEIGECAFGNCGNLGGIYVAAENASLSGKGGVLFSLNGSVLVCCPAGKPGDYAIPAGVTEIESHAFGGCAALASVEIPEGVVAIGEHAFDGCAGLAELAIPDSVTELGDGAFSRCTGLEVLYVPGEWEGTEMLEGAEVPAGCTVVYVDGGPARPENDDYAAAEDLGKTAAGTVAGSNEGATWEAGEPNIHGGVPRTNSVWWTWTAPATGVARFDTAGSEFDTVLGVFTNGTPDDIAGLKTVRSDDNGGGEGGASLAWFNTASGRKYWIAVAGCGGQDSGQIALNWQQCVKVAFKGNGATSGTMGILTNAYKTATPLPACGFEKTGHACDGWATSATGTVAYATDAAPAFAKNTTLYAHWAANAYAVTLDPQGGTGGTESVQATFGSALPAIEPPVLPGYVFGGYYSGTDGTGTQYYTPEGLGARAWDIAGTGTLHAKWTRKASGGKHYALCVGVNDYASSYLDSSFRLAGCVPDANRIWINITRRGEWTPETSVRLLDSAATKAAIRKAIADAAAKAVRGDVFFYYHSSHGGSDYGNYDVYLCAHDAAYADLELAEDLARFASGVKVVVMVDACNSGGLFKSVNGRKSPGRAGGGSFDLARRVSAAIDARRSDDRKRGIKAAKISSDEIGWLTAADYNQYSWDSDKGGDFTLAAVKGWTNGVCDSAGYGDQDGYANFYELWNYAKDVAKGYAPPLEDRTDAQCFNTNVLLSTIAGLAGPIPPPDEWTIALDPQGGTGGTPSVTAVCGEPLPDITVPVRPGYAFGGYFGGTNGTGTQYYGPSGSGLRMWDVASDATLYARWTKVEPQTVWRFYAQTYKGHFFTISETEKANLIATSKTWAFQGGAYRAYKTQVSGTVPLYRFYSEKYKGHFFTRSEAEKDGLVATSKTWKYQGIAFYVHPNAAEGSVPVYRFWSDAYGHHFYTASEAEKDSLVTTSKTWKYQGIAFWALPLNAAMVSFDAAGGTCGTETKTYVPGKAYGSLPGASWDGHAFLGWFTAASGGTRVTAQSIVEGAQSRTLYAHWEAAAEPLKVWRFYSEKNKGHFFTISEAEKTQLLTTSPTWTFQGGAYRAYKTKVEGTVPLYRFYSERYKGHFFTRSETEKDGLVATSKSWKFQGIAYYVYPEAADGRIPVYRFWSDSYGHHFYTASEAEKDSLVATSKTWKYQGIAFWALPNAAGRGAESRSVRVEAKGSEFDGTHPAAQERAGDRASVPAEGFRLDPEVTTSDGTDGRAAADGDEGTAWVPQHPETGSWLVLTFDEPIEVTEVTVLGENLPEETRVLLSEDAGTWFEGEAGTAQYVWVAFPPVAGDLKVREVWVSEEQH